MIESYQIADSRGEWFIITDEDSLDDAQREARWIKTTTPVRLEQ